MSKWWRRFVHWFNWREVSDAIAKALATAHARGRAEGLEAAAQVAESWEPEWQITVQEAFVRQEIAAALRALRRPHKGKQEQAEARVAALEEALAEMGNAMEAGAYDAAWTIRNAALTGTEGK